MEKVIARSDHTRVSTILWGRFRLDGGSMFGSVPKNLWEKKISADKENCIALALRGLLIEQDQRKILVDVGMGEKWSEKERYIYGLENSPLPVDPLEITDIILTHLHFDHAGGISKWNSEGKPVPVFPNARVYLQRANLENARDPNRKEKASYLPDNVNALEQYKLTLLDGDVEALPDIHVHRVDGHTVGQQWVEIRVGEVTIAFPTDLLPTSHHTHPAFHLGYDICALTAMKEKEEFLKFAAERKAIVIFQHDIDTVSMTGLRSSLS